MNLKTSDFYYDLPKELIAQDPLLDRTESRLLALNRNTGEMQHSYFKDICRFLKKGDCLVLNNTKVLPARLFGIKKDTGATIELLLLKRLSDSTWETLVKPGKKAKVGTVISFGGGILEGTIEEVFSDGNRKIKFVYDGIFEEILNELGEMPLPPYITHKLKDQNRYQTVYAKEEGSAAAPTAGLHFTKELLNEIEAKGITICYVTLHVGLGTFRPVKVSDVSKHKMHTELYEVTEETAAIINHAKANGKRILCVGTTSCRTLESAADENGIVQPGRKDTDIFMYPGYQFKVMDGLITNFHLPESTLLMLVSAFSSKEYIFKAYEEAIKEKYRFFSFGDAMIIVDNID